MKKRIPFTLFLALTSGSTFAAPSIMTETIVSGLDNPVNIAHAGDGSGRLFINQKAGQIQLIQPGSGTVSATFADLSDRVLTPTSSYDERGLLGLVFDPNYTNNGYFYVNYSSRTRTPNGCGPVSLGDTVISRFSVDSNNANLADSNSELCLLTIPQPYSNHNGGQLAFGPDGFLYIAVGDGGSANDPLDAGQNNQTLLGKILRLDVHAAAPYIPASNPFVGQANTEEAIWATGLRNPWRFSFDRNTGDLFIADVGQYNWEEINFQSASSTGGENYGWDCLEGTHSHTTNATCLPNPIAPILEYSHSGGNCSVTGGYRYRGANYPVLNGYYFYGDWCTGIVWAAQPGTGQTWDTEQVLNLGMGLNSFGEDENGEIYAVMADGRLLSIQSSELIFKSGFESN